MLRSFKIVVSAVELELDGAAGSTLKMAAPPIRAMRQLDAKACHPDLY
jgi:hypothetical protein